LARSADQDQCAAAIGHQATLQERERVGDHPRIQYIVDGDRRLEGGARGLARPFTAIALSAASARNWICDMSG
jgi:hypothetical protein